METPRNGLGLLITSASVLREVMGLARGHALETHYLSV